MNIFCIVSIRNDSQELLLSNVFGFLKKEKKRKLIFRSTIILLSRILENGKEVHTVFQFFSFAAKDLTRRCDDFFFFPSFFPRNFHPRIFLLVIPSAECKFNEYPPHFNHVSLIRRVILIFIKDTL